MFTGIIESLGKIKALKKEGGNLHIEVRADFTHELQIDQSVAHNGVCLTVVALNEDIYTVTAIEETLQKTNLSKLKEGSAVNLERCMKLGGRLDGHIVQGHVDDTGVCMLKEETDGSWRFVFSYNKKLNQIIVEKGSICINGISLTAFNVTDNSFEVAIIPYTYAHTNLHQVNQGDTVNLEFDIIGKYIAQIQNLTK
ncbi:MAG: riboflavin synthase [Chitinophagales bacterium]|nr:riboflavin synthase [Chitinophagales bacterium]